MADKHFYKEHEMVKEVLTSKYGFEYTGLGDNSEECFHKSGSNPESIYIHPMFCSYSMDSSDAIYGWRIRHHDQHFPSNHKSETSQTESFSRLLNYLDAVYKNGSPNIPYKKANDATTKFVCPHCNKKIGFQISI